jgi:hypothetical protein
MGTLVYVEDDSLLMKLVSTAFSNAKLSYAPFMAAEPAWSYIQESNPSVLSSASLT